MPFKKKIKVEAPKAPEEIKPSEALAKAKYKIEYFTAKRKAAESVAKIKEFDFWVAHFKKIVADLEK